MGYFEKQTKTKQKEQNKNISFRAECLNGSDMWSVSRKVEHLDIFFEKESAD